MKVLGLEIPSVSLPFGEWFEHTLYLALYIIILVLLADQQKKEDDKKSGTFKGMTGTSLGFTCWAVLHQAIHLYNGCRSDPSNLDYVEKYNNYAKLVTAVLYIVTGADYVKLPANTHLHKVGVFLIVVGAYMLSEYSECFVLVGPNKNKDNCLLVTKAGGQTCVKDSMNEVMGLFRRPTYEPTGAQVYRY